jgi:hypothetical protein
VAVEDAVAPELVAAAGAPVVVEVAIAVVVVAGCAVVVVAAVPDPQPRALRTSATTTTQTMMIESKRLLTEHLISPQGREVRKMVRTLIAYRQPRLRTS